MRPSNQKVLSASIAFLLVVCINIPSVVKLTHYLIGQHLLGCQEKNALHIHKAEFDCAFQKFKLAPQVLVDLQKIEFIPFVIIHEGNHPIYVFQSNYQKLHFSLRAPPSVT